MLLRGLGYGSLSRLLLFLLIWSGKEGGKGILYALAFSNVEGCNARHCSFRYLIPCNHMMLSQRWAVKERDCYSVSAAKLLALTPVCCSTGITLTLESQGKDYILWTKAAQTKGNCCLGDDQIMNLNEFGSWEEVEEKWWVTINWAIRLHWKADLIPSVCPGLWKPYSTWVAVKIHICENNVQIHDGNSCGFTSAYSCFTDRMWAGLSEILHYSADLLAGTSCAFMNKSLNSLIFLPYWVVGAKTPPATS